jgi:mannose-6-phosphate isomerase-like protein (cupin superfamily)
MDLSESEMRKRLVTYGELRPCTTAFVDARTPGSDRKENFTIIGPGVAENPEQYVHINIPHGFNVGGARQPPRCVNSQHSHDTAEVFIVHSGRWRFKTGENGDDGFVDLSEGDTISIPTHVFRGFENIGDTTGFMFAVLAPYVFDSARAHGLLLLESGRLIDTNVEAVPDGAHAMPPTTRADVAQMRVCSSAELLECIVRLPELSRGSGVALAAGFDEHPIIGSPSPGERMPSGPLNWPHGFALRAFKVAPGALLPSYWRCEEEVLLIHRGELLLKWQGGSLRLNEGDAITIPKLLPRTLKSVHPADSVAFVIRGTDRPQPIRWAQSLETVV